MNEHPKNVSSHSASSRCGKQFKGRYSVFLLLLLTSCASQSLLLEPVGPAQRTVSSGPIGTGQLQVFTETDEYEVDHDVPYFPHRDYQIYTPDGKRLQRIWNSQNHEDETPTIVNLPVGRYEVRADAEFYGPVRVPVQIRANELTKVVLQPGWKPKRPVSSNEVVSMPNGYAVGWSAK